LSPVDLTAIGLNATVGSGIFLLPDDLFREMGAWSPLAFLLCAVGLLPVAWCFADAARRTHSTGGPYEYARQELGDVVGSSVGWMWVSDFPCFLEQITPVIQSGELLLIDGQKKKVSALNKGNKGWKLVALSGGHPISVFGEWSGELFVPLSVVSDRRIIAL
jgi:hypothetical protein